MIDIKNKKCIKCNLKQPHFNYPNKQKGLYCKSCKLEDMADIVTKRCITCNLKNHISIIQMKKKQYIANHAN